MCIYNDDAKMTIFNALKSGNTEVYSLLFALNPNMKLYKYCSGNSRNIDALKKKLLESLY